MTPEEKIAALVEHIKKEFPKGCMGVECETCPLNVGDDTSFEHDICMILANLYPKTPPS